MTDKQKLVDFVEPVQEFLDTREWVDELSVDNGEKTVNLVTGVSFSGQNGGKLYIEGWMATGILQVTFYLPFNCRESKLNEMAILINEIHNLNSYGRFQCLPNKADRRIRWIHRVDFEGMQPRGIAINNIVGPGWNLCDHYFEAIAAVAMTKQTAHEALADLNANPSPQLFQRIPDESCH